MYIKMNELLVLMTLTAFLGTFVVPIDGGTCVCTCSSGSAGNTTVACSSCTTSYCASKYSSACGSASLVSALCSGVALPTTLVSVMVASLLGLFFVI